MIESVGGPLRLKAYVSEVGVGPEAPEIAGPGPIERVEIAYRFPFDAELKWLVYEIDGELQFWIYDVRGHVVNRHFRTTSAADFDGMARYCFLATLTGARLSLGLSGVYLSTYPDPVKELPRGFELIRPPWKSWHLTESATGRRWVGDEPHLMVNFAKSLAFPLAELAEVLVSPTAEPLAVQLLRADSSGWNDDLTSPYDPAYNERLQRESL